MAFLLKIPVILHINHLASQVSYPLSQFLVIISVMPITTNNHFFEKKCIRIFIYTKTNMMRLERRHFYSIFHIYSRTFAACRKNKYICIYGKTTMTPTVAPVNVTVSTTSVLVCSNLPPPSYVSV